MIYFAYGSNMFSYRLEKRIGKVEIIGKGKLYQHKLQFNKKSVDGSLKANAFFTGKQEDSVIGVLFKINPNKKDDLDKLEGLGKGYDQKEVEIESSDSGKQVKAFTYVANPVDSSENDQPYDWYLEFIKQGAEEHSLPEEYKKDILATSSKVDTDIIRPVINKSIINESKAIRKQLSDSFELVFDINKPKEYIINLPSHALHNRKIIIEKSERQFNFQTDSVIQKGIQRHKELQVSGKQIFLNEEGKESKIFVEGKHFLLNTIEYDFDNNLKLLSGSINSFGNSNTSGFNEKYLRLIIPLSKKLKIINDYQSRGFVVDYKLKPGLITLKINERNFHFYEVKYGEKEYIIIDCVDRFNLKEFRNVCQTILLTYAFLSGDYHSGEGYYLGFETVNLDTPTHFLYHSLSESIYDGNAAFTTNAYFGIDLEKVKRDEKGFISEETRKEQFKDLTFFSNDVYSAICQTALEDEKIFRSLLLLVFNDSSTLEMKIPIQYVAIEALTGAIVKKGNAELKPIENNDIANELADSLKAETEKILKKHNILIEGNDLITPLFKRLASLNAPTNTDKLSKPFAGLGYIISDEEKKLIKLRDTFLHGSTKSYGDLDDDFKGLFYLSLKLHFLICVLLLKKSGFEGRIINYPKLYEYITEKYIEEEVLRKI
jgi:gamma-glutamylcyclotransferase (GGCT)/AIG2-like uncharacterized protein YtfP